MGELQWKIDGSRFRSPQEYQAAMRDKALIDSITDNLSLDKPQDIEKLYHELKRGKIKFESIVGRQFDDNIYELYERLQWEKTQKLQNELLQKEKRKQDIDKIRQTVLRAGNKSSNKEKINLQDFDKKMQKKILLEMKKRQKKRKLIAAGCLTICLICFGYFGYYYQVAAKSADEFAELAQLKESAAQNPQASKNVVVHRTNAEDIELPDILSEYSTLYQKNQKLIGWIKIDDTVIDYPVMQTANNEYYLNHDFYQNEDKNGCIFMDYQCDVIKGCDNIILYGHHMQSGKMFGSLSKYSSENYYKEHPTIQFDTIYEKGTYQIMYVFRSKVYSEGDVTFKYYQFINAASEKEFNSAMYEMAALSLYDTGINAAYGDQILTLSTCDYQENNGRFVVVAKKTN